MPRRCKYLLASPSEATRDTNVWRHCEAQILPDIISGVKTSMLSARPRPASMSSDPNKFVDTVQLEMDVIPVDIKCNANIANI